MDAFNFSLEPRQTVLNIVHVVAKQMGRLEWDPVIQNTASSEIREQYLGCANARSLGWSPANGLEAVVRESSSFGNREAAALQ